MNEFKAKLQSRNATAAVIGLGYVGLPLAMEIAAAGFRVIGIDLDEKKIALQPDAATSGRDAQPTTLPAYSVTGNLERVDANRQ